MNEEGSLEAPVGTSVSATSFSKVKQVIEALLFASDEPVSLQTLRIVFDDVNRDLPENDKITASNEDIRGIVDQLNAEYRSSERAYRIQQLAGGYVYATEKEFATWVGKLFKEKARRRLSQTAVETLAIIAYKQPITKSEVEFIRGVNADYILKTLLEKNLVTITGRAHGPGRPLLYGTTGDFLRHFGLNEITDLPKPREIEELIGETELEVEKRMMAEQDELDFKEKLEEKADPNSRAPHIPRKKSKLQEPQKDVAAKTVVEKQKPPVLFAPEEKELVGVRPAAEPTPVVEPNTAADSEIKEISQREAPGPDSTQGMSPAESAVQDEVRTAKEENIGFVVDEAVPDLPEAANDIPRIPTVVPSSVSDEAIIDARNDSEDTDTPDSQKGWSKWKTKVKMFFRKLFG